MPRTLPAKEVLCTAPATTGTSGDIMAPLEQIDSQRQYRRHRHTDRQTDDRQTTDRRQTKRFIVSRMKERRAAVTEGDAEEEKSICEAYRSFASYYTEMTFTRFSIVTATRMEKIIDEPLQQPCLRSYLPPQAEWVCTSVLHSLA
uniref:Uncharacterized protein n=1 Tax=Haemonchus contortus TaxID=6289 RepID=A0A7I4XTQ3_HAECO